MNSPLFPSQGVFRQPDGRVLFCVWAPRCRELVLVTWDQERRSEAAMRSVGDGYFVHPMAAVAEGTRYAYRLPDGRCLPDPASRWQPDGVHRPSAVCYPEDFVWTDGAWQGLRPDGLVIYELHVGTFTPAGTFDGVVERLADLAELGVTAIELMPIAQFPGARNWGYDGVHPYAPQSTYGGPRGLQRLVDAAHRQGLGVVLDVVYNHLGPEGNYAAEFGPYFTNCHRTPWGDAMNFDGPDCEPVRRFVLDNARMWIRDYHVDALRLDAVQMIFDLGARHILQELQDEVQQEAARQGRRALVIAETDQNDPRLVLPAERGGHGLDGVWSDDFHHAVHALLAGEREGYYAAFGDAEHVVKAYNRVFVRDGNWDPFRRRRHGASAGDLPRRQFVVCVQNHDQIGNRAQGERLATLLPPAAQRLAAGLLLLSPCVPLLFMGEEYGESRPFLFFCSYGNPALQRAVRRGRRRELAERSLEGHDKILDPCAEKTFLASQLQWAWPDGSLAGGMRRLYQDLLAARRQWPALAAGSPTRATLVDAPAGTDRPGVIELRRGADDALIAWANCTPQAVACPARRPPDKVPWLSTADRRYGGTRELNEAPGHLEAYELLILGPSGGPR